MHRLAWFLTGAIVAYIGSGYIDGLLSEDPKSNHEKDQKQCKENEAKAAC